MQGGQKAYRSGCYCFGGTVVLNAASMGIPLQAAAIFHSGLRGFKASSLMKNTKVLILQYPVRLVL